MAVKFFPLTVKEIVNETQDAVSVYFTNPGDSSFDYLPGQYLTLKFQINGEEVRRAYSLCSSPYTDSDLCVTVKRVDGGLVSNYIPDNVSAGSVVDVMQPMGNFTVTPNENASKHYVLVGGGSGITPLMSIIKSVLTKEPHSVITLLYGNRDEASIIFKSELEALSAENEGRLRIKHVLDQGHDGWTGLTGRLDRNTSLPLLQDIAKSDQLSKVYYLCGPAEMMEEVQATLGFIGVAKTDIHRELFTSKLASSEEEISTAGESSGEAKRGTYDVAIIVDGEEKTATVNEGSTILEAAIDEGMDPPFACQMGVCTTCRAKLHSGKVEMEENEGLSDSELEEGYILTCQSHALTPDVKVEYM